MRVVASVEARTPRQLATWLIALQTAAAIDLRHADIPPLYRTGVRYARERPGSERWQLPTQAFITGHADCEELAAWRAAELRLNGEKARVALIRPRPGLWHVVVRRADGTIEDPSKLLGMKGPG